MASITLKGNPIETAGDLPSVGSSAPGFTLVDSSLGDVALSDFYGSRIVLNIFPSLDTGVCAAAVRRFNSEAAGLSGTVILCISADLPFAHKRFCEAEGIDNVVTLSTFRNPEFGRDYGVVMTSGPLRGMMSRSVVILDERGTVVYIEQVPEIAQEPDYEEALSALS